jgi:hypothetical protein
MSLRSFLCAILYNSVYFIEQTFFFFNQKVESNVLTTQKFIQIGREGVQDEGD